MSIRFAASAQPDRIHASAPIARVLVTREINQAANDNGEPVSSDQMMRAALRHFGEHGLGAARAARALAEEAFFAGDRQGYDWWLGITRTLDRRLAAEASAALPNTEFIG